jgi:hypothetical protein
MAVAEETGVHRLTRELLQRTYSTIRLSVRLVTGQRLSKIDLGALADPFVVYGFRRPADRRRNLLLTTRAWRFGLSGFLRFCNYKGGALLLRGALSAAQLGLDLGPDRVVCFRRQDFPRMANEQLPIGLLAAAAKLSCPPI